MNNVQPVFSDAKWTELLFVPLLDNCRHIGDFGAGPLGAPWWDKTSAHIDAFDLNFTPQNQREHVSFHQLDLTVLYTLPKFAHRYDLIVADHIFEHVASPVDLAKSVAHALKSDGLLHVGIPDATNFTDRFYRLIHPDGGGHIAQFTKESFLDLITPFGFDVLHIRTWADDWLWFEKLYSLKAYKVSHLTSEEKSWLADVFRKELTPERGYIYGWEFLLKKTR